MLISKLESNLLLIKINKKQRKTIYKCNQIPYCNGCYVTNKLNDLPIEMGFYKNPFGQNKVEWFLNKAKNVVFQLRELFKLIRKPKITTKWDK